MRQELIELLGEYRLSEVTLHDCYVWLAGVPWDDSAYRSDKTLVQQVGILELLAIETLEGLRDESEFQNESIKSVEALLNLADFQWNMAGGKIETASTTVEAATGIGDQTIRAELSFA